MVVVVVVGTDEATISNVPPPAGICTGGRTLAMVESSVGSGGCCGMVVVVVSWLCRDGSGGCVVVWL